MIIHYSLLFISYQFFIIELNILFYAQFIKFERMEVNRLQYFFEK